MNIAIVHAIVKFRENEKMVYNEKIGILGIQVILKGKYGTKRKFSHSLKFFFKTQIFQTNFNSSDLCPFKNC